MKIERPHRSHSQLRLWKRCQVAYGFRYDEGIRGPKGVAAIRGIAVHESVSTNLRQKIKSRRNMVLGDVIDCAAGSVQASFADSFHLTTEERSIGVRKVRDRTVDVSVEMARAFHIRQAPHIKPLYVEKLVVLKTDPNRLDFDLMVRIDHATRDGDVVDVKTMGKPMRVGAEHLDEQLTLYYPSHKAMTGRYPKRVSFIVVHQHGNQPAFIDRRYSTRNSEDVKSIIETLKVADAGIRDGNRMPTSFDNWWCSEKFCDYWMVCPYVKGIRNRRRTHGAA
jgi:hypothetical protein